MAQKGLGSGLGALFGDDLMDEGAGASFLPIAKLEPRQDQPRKTFDEEALAELSESIKEHGVIQPIIVRELTDGYYQIIAGERRWRAARMAGLMEVPVRIMDADDKKAAELALIENLQREDLNPIEEALGYKSLMELYGMTQEKAAQRVGRSRPVIANALRLLTLPESVTDMIESGKLTLSHARLILELEDDEERKEAAKIAVERDLSVRETSALVKKLAAGESVERKKPDRRSSDGVDYYAEVEKELTRSMGRHIRINAGAKKGKFEIEYYGSEDFERLYTALKSISLTGGEKK